MSILDEVTARQADWSLTADQLKRSFQRARWFNFGLTIIAALFAAIASQLEGTPRLTLAILSAAMFGVATLLTARLVGAENAQKWVRARAASESLKRLAWTYAAGAVPYNEAATRDGKLKADAQQIERQVDELLGDCVSAPPKPPFPAALTPAEYVERRVASAAAWYTRRADECKVVVGRLRRGEFVLALATAVITAAAGVLGKDVARGAGSFDFVALTAVFTTVAGAILAHIEASHFDFTIWTYRQTALQLRDALIDAPITADPASQAWSDFVQACEALIAAENGSWVLKMGKV
jgi:hypothetical protein